MKLKIFTLLFFLTTVFSFCQSSLVFDTGTNIEVTGTADICADVITINGTFSGDGTQCNSPLPTELSLFYSIVENGKIELHWQTTTEVNNYGFEIQRMVRKASSFSDIWEKIGFVKGSGNSNSPKEYTFIDNSFYGGKAKYRLKQIDNDGSFSYSPEVEMELSVPKEFSLKQNYPNPFNPKTTISFSLKDAGLTTLTIYNALGQEIMKLIDNEYLEAGEYHYREFDASRFPSGMYISKLQDGHSIKTIKMILSK